MARCSPRRRWRTARRLAEARTKPSAAACLRRPELFAAGAGVSPAPTSARALYILPAGCPPEAGRPAGGGPAAAGWHVQFGLWMGNPPQSGGPETCLKTGNMSLAPSGDSVHSLEGNSMLKYAQPWVSLHHLWQSRTDCPARRGSPATSLGRPMVGSRLLPIAMQRNSPGRYVNLPMPSKVEPAPLTIATQRPSPALGRSHQERCGPEVKPNRSICLRAYMSWRWQRPDCLVGPPLCQKEKCAQRKVSWHLFWHSAMFPTTCGAPEWSMLRGSYAMLASYSLLLHGSSTNPVAAGLAVVNVFVFVKVVVMELVGAAISIGVLLASMRTQT
mmetsp:Transcript_99727/g.282225  ORF Transcript_99727/g.282225 Transcript_99727/m.282225 type:complete len:330 (+) Transcript_99727:270-1259(+)